MSDLSEEELRREIEILEAKLEAVEECKDRLYGVSDDPDIGRQIHWGIRDVAGPLEGEISRKKKKLAILTGELESPPGWPEFDADLV